MAVGRCVVPVDGERIYADLKCLFILLHFQQSLGPLAERLDVSWFFGEDVLEALVCLFPLSVLQQNLSFLKESACPLFAASLNCSLANFILFWRVVFRSNESLSTQLRSLFLKLFDQFLSQ